MIMMFISMEIVWRMCFEAMIGYLSDDREFETYEPQLISIRAISLGAKSRIGIREYPTPEVI